jgi:PAS domain-containing protein
MNDPHAGMIDAIPGLAWSARPDGFIEFVGRRWREYTGLDDEHIKGWAWTTPACSKGVRSPRNAVDGD